ncbi:MAG TPA: succinate dehydrogenase, hydrophobic membrane anchor protein [Rhodospirillaceae bacterium]|nr:succinate dehydrogenase, hydrophobic membrane anchor protein [Rhodospirillaceae bacterium]
MANKWEATPFKSPTARVTALGSAHAGLHHWIHQRVTALANIPLVLWAVWSALTMAAAGGNYDIIRGFFAQPVNAVLMILFLTSIFYHAALGLQVVIEDYFHGGKSKLFLLIAVKLGLFALGLASVFSVLKLAL